MFRTEAWFIDAYQMIHGEDDQDEQDEQRRHYNPPISDNKLSPTADELDDEAVIAVAYEKNISYVMAYHRTTYYWRGRLKHDKTNKFI